MERLRDWELSGYGWRWICAPVAVEASPSVRLHRAGLLGDQEDGEEGGGGFF